MSNEIDFFMDLPPDELLKHPEAVDAVIAYHRQRRAEREAGGGKRATKDVGPKQSLGSDFLAELKKTRAAPATNLVKRRI